MPARSARAASVRGQAGPAGLGQAAEPGRVLRVLSAVHATLGRRRLTRRLTRVLPLRWAGRRWLSKHMFTVKDRREPSVTVLIGVRDRCDQRLKNALASLREQTYPCERLRICIVDYGSDAEQAECVRSLCRSFDVEYVAVTGVSAWSRAHCLNIGIRQCQTRYLLVSDVDVVFSPQYVEDAVATLSRDSLTAVASTMWDLPQAAVADQNLAAAEGRAFPMAQWLPRCAVRRERVLHPSILMIYTKIFELIGGYDEFFRFWGYEDWDIERRLGRLGIDIVPADGDSFYLHQWHPRFEGVDSKDLEAHIARNKAYFQSTTGILRNGSGWGLTS